MQKPTCNLSGIPIIIQSQFRNRILPKTKSGQYNTPAGLCKQLHAVESTTIKARDPKKSLVMGDR